jgi:hypothetical protein
MRDITTASDIYSSQSCQLLQLNGMLPARQ